MDKFLKSIPAMAGGFIAMFGIAVVVIDPLQDAGYNFFVQLFGAAMILVGGYIFGAGER